MKVKDLTLLFIAGGKSSRFGGEPKMLSKIGPKEETLFEMSIGQMMNHIHIVQIHVVVNKDNMEKIMDEVKRVNQKHEICKNITYNIQEIPEFRTKPWGTADAVSSAKGHIHTPFLLLNSDDLYDSKTFELIGEQCDLSKNYIIGFTLGSTLSGNQKANRGFISTNQDGKVIELQEKLNIERDYYSKYRLENQYVSVNLLLLQPTVLSYMDHELNDFKERHQGQENVEALLPNFLNSLMKQDILSMELFKTSGQWNGVTYKDDVQSVREAFLSPRKEN
jgi:choline kinase